MTRSLAITGGAVITPDGALAGGHVVASGGMIAAVGDGPAPTADEVFDAGGGWIVPGFVDLQVNGAYGVDVTTMPERIDELGVALVRHGVTAFVPTVVTCPPARRQAVLDAWACRPVGASAPVGAVALGLHLEGPMLAPSRRGAHDAAHLACASLELVADWSPTNGVVMVTLAPELPSALDVVGALVARGVVVALGHSDASAEEFAAGITAGAGAVTHLYNAMRPFGHRDPGPVGATFDDDDVVAGLICDGRHVDPVAVRLAWRVLGRDRLVLVSDAVAALRGDGAAMLGDVAVTTAGGGVRTAGGVLAGSDVALDACLRRFVADTGATVTDAVATVTSTPAALLGDTSRGRLEPGRRADVTVLGGDLRVVATIVGGEVAWRS